MAAKFATQIKWVLNWVKINHEDFMECCYLWKTFYVICNNSPMPLFLKISVNEINSYSYMHGKQVLL